jgi:membrane fusion protein (multidrug efflux system)
MKPIAFLRRRPLGVLLFVLALVVAGTVGLTEMRASGTSSGKDAGFLGYLDGVGAKARRVKGYLAGQLDSYLREREEPEESHAEHHKVVATNPAARDVTITDPYVCQIHSQKHIEIRALESGYLEEVLVREGQSVKKGHVMFRVVPTLYQARLDAENAEAQLALLKYNNTRRLHEQKVVSENEVALVGSELAKAQAKAKLAAAELNFTFVRAPFDGIVDRLEKQLGSLVAEGDILTTLSDNSVMWVYFNVPEARYLEYMTDRSQNRKEDRIRLRLADGKVLPVDGKIGAIEAKFDNTTGNIPFRADFPNPRGLLRHGQTGTILLSRVHEAALVIPQRAVFEVLDKSYVYVVGEDDKVHQRPIVVEHEQDDIYLVGEGITAADRILIDGIQQVRDGDAVECEFRTPEQVLGQLKFHAE